MPEAEINTTFLHGTVGFTKSGLGIRGCIRTILSSLEEAVK